MRISFHKILINRLTIFSHILARHLRSIACSFLPTCYNCSVRLFINRFELKIYCKLRLLPVHSLLHDVPLDCTERILIADVKTCLLFSSGVVKEYLVLWAVSWVTCIHSFSACGTLGMRNSPTYFGTVSRLNCVFNRPFLWTASRWCRYFLRTNLSVLSSFTVHPALNLLLVHRWFKLVNTTILMCLVGMNLYLRPFLRCACCMSTS